MASWYYLSNGQQVGPVDLDALRQLIYAGQISPAELVWCDGMAGWLPVTSVPQLADLVAPQPYNAASPPYAPPTGYAAANPYCPQTYSLTYGGAPRRSGGTTAVGVISIIWGGLFVLCVGGALAVALNMPKNRSLAVAPVDYLTAFASLALHGCLAASGVGTLMRKQWAKVMVWIIAAPLIALYSYNTFTSLSKHHELASQAAEGGYYCGLLLTVGAGAFWLLFLIWFYQRPAVKQEFESAAGGSGQQGGGYGY